MYEKYFRKYCVSLKIHFEFYYSMDNCKSSADKQQWLLDAGDGSQVMCLHDKESSQEEKATDVSTQSTPLKRPPPPIHLHLNKRLLNLRVLFG